MSRRLWNNNRKAWEWAETYGHDGEAWTEILTTQDDEFVDIESSFDKDTYLGRGTILQRDVQSMEIHPDTDAMAQFMWDWTPFGPAGGWGAKTSINTSSFGTQPIHMYIVDSSHPAVEYQVWNAISTGTSTLEQNLYMKGDVPMAPWMVPAQNGDRGLAIYDRATGIMRELFMAVKNSAGEWTGGGGYSIVTPGLQNLAEDNYALQQRRGLSNVAGMHNSLGFIGIAEALNKKINHALCFTFGASWSSPYTYQEILDIKASNGGTLPVNWPPSGGKVSWPARAADGKAERYIPESTWTHITQASKTYTNPTPDLTPTHGQWGRLKADVDPMFDPRTGKPYRALTRVLIEAAKTYGLVGTDTNLWCNAFNAEQGRTFAQAYGQDPWAAGGIIDKNYWENGATGQGQGLNISDFPWDRTEWATIDWGRPSPDMNLRPGQIIPWTRPGS